MCQTEGYDDFAARRVQVCWCVVERLISHLFFLLIFPYLLSTDNMVDQTKVEASETKASELGKKVKRTQTPKCAQRHAVMA